MADAESTRAQAPDATVEPAIQKVPTEPGWYWYSGRRCRRPEIVEVFVHDWALTGKELTMRFARSGGLVGVKWTAGLGRWSDRIEPPADMMGGAE